MAKAPFSKTWFSDNDLGPKPGGLKPVKLRPRRPLESRNGEKAKNIKKHNGKSMVLASWGPLLTPLGRLSGRLGGLLGRLEAVLGIWGSSLGV